MKTTRKNHWTRREFTTHSVLAMLSGVTVTLAGCSDSNTPTAPSTPATPTPTPTPIPNLTPPAAQNATGVVGSNHGHTAEVSAAQITAAADFALDIMGDSNHSHTVNLTAGDLAQIAAGTRVSKMSTNNSAHAHSVTFN
jgi:hypothetical protein